MNPSSLSEARLVNNRNKLWFNRILDPSGKFLAKWDRIFLGFCLTGLFIDPLTFYSPYIGGQGCISIDHRFLIEATVIRTFVDMSYLMHLIFKFRTAFILPGSTVIGRGKLVMDPHQIALRYMNSDLITDFAAMLPLAQVIGASWYLVSIQRVYDCWAMESLKEAHTFFYHSNFLDCKSLSQETERVKRTAWLNATRALHSCDATNEDIQFKYGIFADALTSNILSASFLEKYFYCLWFGLRSITSFGQSLFSSGYLPETTFSYLICIMGLVLFGLLIGNVQRYLQSTTARIEEWRVKRREIEEWMRIRQLPEDLQKRVRQFVQFKWVATRGVDERTILPSLPRDLRRDIQRHLCLSLVHQVPFFSHMDAQLLDALSERLVSHLSIGNTFVIREGDPVHEMLFILRGKLESSKVKEGRNGIYNSFIIGPGDFCCEELLNWALKPNQSPFLPLSTRTVRTLCDVEGFSLQASDIIYVASQFKRFNNRRLKYAFRSSSAKWRTWGACFIQAAWKRYKKIKKDEEKLCKK